jgi:hypothetical protein
MCYSVEASKLAFFTNIISCIILHSSNKPILKTIALFFGYIGIVQLYDWILWENQNNQINKIITKIEMIHINLEPIILAYLIFILKGKLNNISLNITIIYSIFVFVFSLQIFNDSKYDYTPIENNRLIWKWNNTTNSKLVYILFVLSFILLSYNNFEYPYNILFVTLTCSSLLFGLYYKNEEAGRYWCKISAYIPLLFILL